ncbi:alpha/beta hydrolase [Bacillus taeanensis]|uniref:Alpha/beta hydrolase n=1 Tax=Bacillus taeanensis TaxID=273032 RepID=A0A366Y552_9BACI|nr:alpha/beta hydrolase [Bacillus taeanensis]RBW71341.1 alpha/beta hydrolase [Bacillus taeanensis]
MVINEKDLYSQGLRINVQNVDVYYEKYDHPYQKNKPTFLMIHGFLSSTFSFRKLLPFLISEYSAISLDLPGFGKTEKSTKFIYSYQNYGKLVVDFIKQLKLKNVIIVGHSMGGQIALQVAKQAPELVKKCILIGASSYLKRAKRVAVYSSYIPFVTWFMKRWFEKKDVKENLLTVVHNKNLVDDELIQGYSKPFEDKHFLDCMIRLLRHREGDLSSEELQKINTPCLLIWGKEDKVVPVNIGQKLVHDLQHAELKIYEKTGHLVCEEKPERLYKDILSFI